MAARTGSVRTAASARRTPIRPRSRTSNCRPTSPTTASTTLRLPRRARRRRRLPLRPRPARPRRPRPPPRPRARWPTASSRPSRPAWSTSASRSSSRLARRSTAAASTTAQPRRWATVRRTSTRSRCLFWSPARRSRTCSIPAATASTCWAAASWTASSTARWARMPSPSTAPRTVRTMPRSPGSIRHRSPGASPRWRSSTARSTMAMTRSFRSTATSICRCRACTSMVPARFSEPTAATSRSTRRSTSRIRISRTCRRRFSGPIPSSRLRRSRTM